MPASRCPHCSSTEIDHDPSRGDAVCMQCGSVLEESIIVSEVQYAQDCAGTSRAVGQLVSAERSITTGFNLGHTFGLTRESRAITLQNARRNISRLATQLTLPDRCIDIAHNFYKMALMKKLTQGRRHTHVIAACVYMVCRKEETPHMLLDLSDILQVNVYDLGRTYLKLSTALCINTPAIDPSLYILRFAHQLEFGDKTHEVSVTASRLIQRMKRDWMHTGRRPSGLCGAALLVAARLHNFSRSVEEVIKVVKVCQATVRKRLTEFGETPSSRLTLDEFMTIDLEEEQDPPAFKAARKKKSLELDEKVQEVTKQITEFQDVIEKALEDARQKKFSKYAKYLSTDEQHDTDSKSSSISEEFIVNNTVESINAILQKDMPQVATHCSELERLLSPFTTTSTDSGYPAGSTTLNFSDSYTDAETPIPETQIGEICPLDITGLDDAELDSYIMGEEETKSKTEFWFTANVEFLRKRKEKEEKRLREEAENSNKEQKKKRKRVRTKIQANTAEEAISKMLTQKKISLKLDYTVLNNLQTPNPAVTVGDDEAVTEDNAEDVKLAVPRPAKRAKTTKAKPTLPPLPSSIRKGISDLIGSQNNTSKIIQPKMEEEPEFIVKESKPPIVKVVQDKPTPEPKVETIVEDDEELDDEELDEESEDETPGYRKPLSAAELLDQRRVSGQDDESEYCDYDYEEDDY